jgi:hypothetical protein
MLPEFTDEVREAASAIIHAPERRIEYRLCARLGIPSVAAIVHEINERFPEFRKHDPFKMWVGREVAKEMRPEYEVVEEKEDMPWCQGYFTQAAVWGKASQ